MTGQLLSQVLDALITASVEGGRDPINIYLGRDQLIVFREQLAGKHPEATVDPQTYRMISVLAWHFQAGAIIVSDQPSTNARLQQ